MVAACFSTFISVGFRPPLLLQCQTTSSSDMMRPRLLLYRHVIHIWRRLILCTSTTKHVLIACRVLEMGPMATTQELLSNKYLNHRVSVLPPKLCKVSHAPVASLIARTDCVRGYWQLSDGLLWGQPTLSKFTLHHVLFVPFVIPYLTYQKLWQTKALFITDPITHVSTLPDTHTHSNLF